ncbi:MAG: hypothetical protein NWE89_13840 [Candidatus Bathyarchaeota archaeon]|nr:hypothetical protein [Candidatus Bathyarchaeota archaeon]
MRQYLTATVQAISKSELDDIVEPLTMQYIKEKDPSPEIRVYSIGHEGKSNLKLPGIGVKTFTWVQAAVRWLADKLRIGTAVFDRHAPDTNSHEGRMQIGQVVGKTVKQIGDRLNTLAAIHIFPQFKSRPLDIASFEAEILYDHDEVQAWPVNIKNVTGIALGSSGTDNPGFPGATLLGAVQAYVQAFAGEIGDKTMNQSDVKSAVKELGLKPSQIFEIGDIMGDSAVDAKVKEVTKDHFAMAKRVGEERDASRTQVVKLENEKAEMEKTLQRHTTQSRSAAVLDSILANPELKLDDKAKVFVKRNLKSFETTATDEDTLKTDLGKFVGEQVKEYGEVAELFGAKDTTTPGTLIIPKEFTVEGQKATDSTIKVPAEIPSTRDEVLKEEMDPKLNPLIPGGEAAEKAQQT